MEAEAHDYIYFVHRRRRRRRWRADIFGKTRRGNSENGCVAGGRHRHWKNSEYRDGKFVGNDAADDANLSSDAGSFEFAAAEYAIFWPIGSRRVSRTRRAVIFCDSDAVVLSRSASQPDRHAR